VTQWLTRWNVNASDPGWSSVVIHVSHWWRQKGHPAPVHHKSPLYMWARPSLCKDGVHDVKGTCIGLSSETKLEEMNILWRR